MNYHLFHLNLWGIHKEVKLAKGIRMTMTNTSIVRESAQKALAPPLFGGDYCSWDNGTFHSHPCWESMSPPMAQAGQLNAHRPTLLKLGNGLIASSEPNRKEARDQETILTKRSGSREHLCSISQTGTWGLEELPGCGAPRLSPFSAPRLRPRKVERAQDAW